MWEGLFDRAIRNPLSNRAFVARMARESWSRLHDWRVPLDKCFEVATGEDQRIFARVASEYRALLADTNAMDDAMLLQQLVAGIGNREIELPPMVSLAGFDRITPATERLLDALRQRNVDVAHIETVTDADKQLAVFESPDAEFRAAGAWARQQLEEDPTARVAVVVTGLESDAAAVAREVREGAVPGWRFGGAGERDFVNVSFGRKLADFPTIDLALRLLHWLHSDVRSNDVSLFLSSPWLGGGRRGDRARFELRFRDYADRNWSPQRVATLLPSRERDESFQAIRAWLDTVAGHRESAAGSATPGEWAELFDRCLRELGWPGEDAEDSDDFQLRARWRELLSQFSELEAVLPAMRVAEAISRLGAMARDTVYQSEGDSGSIPVIGVLEAAGLELDALWVTGLTASAWPASSRPLALVSRSLQEEYGLPDATPADSVAYAERVLERLLGSADNIVLSYPQQDDDGEQSVTGLLPAIRQQIEIGDPGRHASSLIDGGLAALPESVPAIGSGESVSGGAGTLQAQFFDPHSAFCKGRLAADRLWPIRGGLTPLFRGSLIHDALQNLYAEGPSQQEIQSWADSERHERIRKAVAAALSSHQASADDVLRRLYSLEQERVEQLLWRVVDHDLERIPFRIASVEGALDITLHGVRLSLRHDRVDILEDGSAVILDYKTGIEKKFLDGDGEPKDIQLIVYACGTSQRLSGLALYNVDTRAISLQGSGPAIDNSDTFEDDLARWKAEAFRAAEEMTRGDVRVNARQGFNDARPLNLLSRFVELKRDG